MRMTPEKSRAIKKLERALKLVDDAGIAVFGMDGVLLAYDANDFEDSDDQYEKLRTLPSYEIDDGGAYRDSGAF